MAEITKAEWDELEKQVWREDTEKEIGHPVEFARALAPIALKRHTAEEVYAAGEKYADEAIWPHLAYRLSK